MEGSIATLLVPRLVGDSRAGNAANHRLPTTTRDAAIGAHYRHTSSMRTKLRLFLSHYKTLNLNHLDLILIYNLFPLTHFFELKLQK